MNKIKLTVAGAVLGSVLGGLAAATPAFADTHTCAGTMRAVSVDDVRVPKGATCILLGTLVGGNVKVAKDASLVAQKVRVKGDVQAEGARSVSVTGGSAVGGNIQAKDGDSVTVRSTRVDGDIQLEANLRPVSVDRNVVDGNVQLKDNRGGLLVSRNSVEENLQCEDNGTRVTGGQNSVRGDKEGQCSRL
jgi:hypothetical protein